MAIVNELVGGYMDSSQVLHGNKKLSSLLNKLNDTPIGELTLWQGNISITNDTTIGCFYNLKQCINDKFPLKNGFKREVKIVLEGTDDKTSGYVGIKLQKGSYSKTYDLGFTWGAHADGYRTSRIVNFDYGNLPTGHIEINVVNVKPNVVRIYRVYLLIYDKM